MTKLEYKNVEIYQTPDEIAVLRDELRKIKNIKGCVAEVGVYQGATAAIIREELPEKSLYLFDTFEGFADQLHESDPIVYRVGDCKADIEHVKNLMKDEDNVVITKGIFPKTSSIIKDKIFSFVHIDVDIYQATRDSLEFFIPRMSPGGIIIVHDYPAHPGVKKAVDEIIKDKVVKGARQAIIQL